MGNRGDGLGAAMLRRAGDGKSENEPKSLHCACILTVMALVVIPADVTLQSL
jgi:hypothetical protein